MTLCELYKFADREHIEVDYFPMEQTVSASFKEGWICMDVDLLENNDDEKVHLAHELGHIMTGSFYGSKTHREDRRKQECRADRWAAKMLIPKSELDRLAAKGYIEPWELTESFGVTPEFAEKALRFYRAAR